MADEPPDVLAAVLAKMPPAAVVAVLTPTTLLVVEANDDVEAIVAADLAADKDPPTNEDDPAVLVAVDDAVVTATLDAREAARAAEMDPATPEDEPTLPADTALAVKAVLDVVVVVDAVVAATVEASVVADLAAASVVPVAAAAFGMSEEEDAESSSFAPSTFCLLLCFDDFVEVLFTDFANQSPSFLVLFSRVFSFLFVACKATALIVGAVDLLVEMICLVCWKPSTR